MVKSVYHKFCGKVRVHAQAVTGQADVIIDQATLDLVAAHVDVEDLGLQEIKGKADKIACYKVTAWRD